MSGNGSNEGIRDVAALEASWIGKQITETLDAERADVVQRLAQLVEAQALIGQERICRAGAGGNERASGAESGSASRALGGRSS